MQARETELRERLVAGRNSLLATPLEQVDGRGFCLRHSQLIDEVLCGVYELSWRHALATQANHFDPDRTQLTIVATGGYGRRELNPHSDIDIAFVPSEEDNAFLDAATKEAFRLVVELLLDSTDLQVGYAYRPLVDLAHLDHQTVASLLDARFIAGSERLFGVFREEFARQISVLGFVQEKIVERERNVRRGRASVYALEPNIKDGPGGLRDLHGARWLAQAMFQCSAEEALSELVRRGFVSANEVAQVEAAFEFHWRVRNALHLLVGGRRKDEVLRAQHQPRIAEALGYERTAARTPAQLLLADCYRHGERAHAFFHHVAQRLLDTSLPLDAHFRAVRHRIRLINPAQIRDRPGLLVRAFEYQQRYALTLDPELETVVRDCAAQGGDWLRFAEARTALLSILRYGVDLGASLRSLHEHGVLARLLPEFDDLMLLAPGDPAHEFTVGEHTLRALDLLCAIPEIGSDDRSPLPDAFAEVTDFELLVLGVLLHDVGKQHPEGNHARTGAAMARAIGERLGLETARLNTLDKLVRYHLLLPRTSRLRDLDSPVTIRRVAEAVEDRETLKMLYLLSNVDTRAVSAHSYTPLDLQALDELYLKTLLALNDEDSVYDTEALAASQRDRVTRELQGLELSEETVRDLCARLPAAYVINTPLPTIAQHLTLLDRVALERVIADFFQPPRGNYTELTLCTFDDPAPGLLSKICGTLYANEVDIQNARVYTLGARVPIVLDTLRVMRERRPLTTRQVQRLGEQLRQVLLGEVALDELLARAHQPTMATIVTERVSLVNHLSDEHTVVHVVAEDHPGLLFFITRAIAALGLDVHTARIAGWAGMAEDAFYVTGRDGAKVADEEREPLAEKLRAQLAGLEAPA